MLHIIWHDSVSNSDLTIDLPVSNYEGVYTPLNGDRAKRIVNRLTRNDYSFANTTTDPNFTVEEAFAEFEVFLRAYTYVTMHGCHPAEVPWSVQHEVCNHFNSIRRLFLERNLRIIVGSNTAIVRVRNTLMLAVKPSGMKVWAGISKWKTYLDTGNREDVAFCPYTGETNVENLLWFGDRYTRRKYTECYVSKRWLDRAGHVVCQHCGSIVNGELVQTFNFVTGENEARCLGCAGSWCDWHHRYEANAPMTYLGYSHNVCSEGLAEMRANGDIITCDDCGIEIVADRLRRYEDEDGAEHRVCSDCYTLYFRERVDWRNARGLLSYGVKPRAEFYSKDGKSARATEPCYLGMEVELDQRHRPYNLRSHSAANAVASDVMRNMEGHVYCKNDSSLSDGCECVTHPHTIEAVYDLDLEKMLKLADEHHLRANRTCGCHVHASRTAFGSCEDERNETIVKLAIIYQNNYSDLCTIARRDEDEANHWASSWNERHWSYTFSSANEDNAEYIVCDMNSTRYHCLNLENSATVEFRMWGATNNPNEIRAFADFTQAIIKVAKAMSFDDARDVEFKDLLRMVVGKAYNADNVSALIKATYGEF